MYETLLVIHIIVCILLTVVVLLQFGKGAEAGSMLGTAGSSQNIFTSSARGNILTKVTTVLALIFFATSISLTILKSKAYDSSVFDDEIAPVSLGEDDLLGEEQEAVDSEDGVAEEENAVSTEAQD